MNHPSARRALVALVAAAPAALVIQSACVKGAARRADGSPGASASSAGVTAASSSGAGAAPPDAGSDGSGGSGGAGAVPIWAPLASTPLGCQMERMVNATGVRAFTWQPCAGVSACEQVVALPALAGLQLESGTIDEEPGETRMVFEANTSSQWTVYFATDDGWLLDAYRAPTAPSPGCLLYAGGARGSRYGVLIASSVSNPPLANGGLLHTFGDPGDPVPFAVDQPLGYGPNQGSVTMGTSRWAWLCSNTELVTVDSADGGGFDLVAPTFASDAGTLTVAIDSVDTNGSTFLFGDTMVTADGGVTSIIATSDGQSPPTPYLVPTDGSLYDYPAFAGSYVAWLKGIGFIMPNQYQTMELWASPYSSDPSALAPFKVDTLDQMGALRLMGSNGRAASTDVTGATAVWDLATKKRTLYNLPGDLGLINYLGLSSKYLWVAAGPGGVQNNVITTYVRFALQ